MTLGNGSATAQIGVYPESLQAYAAISMNARDFLSGAATFSIDGMFTFQGNLMVVSAVYYDDLGQGDSPRLGQSWTFDIDGRLLSRAELSNYIDLDSFPSGVLGWAIPSSTPIHVSMTGSAGGPTSSFLTVAAQTKFIPNLVPEPGTWALLLLPVLWGYRRHSQRLP